MLSTLFDQLSIPLTAQKIFTELLERGPATARTLAEHIGIPRPSVYDNVKILIKMDLVSERDEENKKVFYIDDLENIPDLVQDKIDTLQSEKKKIEHLLPSLSKQTTFNEPKVKFYSGREGVKQVLNNILWHKNIETIIMWPMSEMLKVLGKDYLAEMNKIRIKNNISIRGIWPKDKKVNFKENPFVGVGEGHLRELRYAPKGMTWNMGYWMYGDKVGFLSSRKEGFGFVVQSKDFAELLRVQFEAIWNISIPVKAEPENTDMFLKTIGK